MILNYQKLKNKLHNHKAIVLKLMKSIVSRGVQLVRITIYCSHIKVANKSSI